MSPAAFLAAGATQKMTTTYRGRFAPSPTGPLHFGSLVAALASWLDAKSNNGEWLVRIEDIDPPRVVPSSASQILKSLELHGLVWDQQVIYQSQQQDLYKEAVQQLTLLDRLYRCSCSRTDLASMGGIYDGRCQEDQNHIESSYAVRFIGDKVVSWQDKIQGTAKFSIDQLGGDFVVVRRDKLFSYQLAVAMDDWQQQITHVIRGYDLFDSTARQIMLLNALDKPLATYAHLPVATNTDGQKLSKQSFAAAIDNNLASANLIKALGFLGQNIDDEMENSPPETILHRATKTWTLSKVPALGAIQVC